MMAGKLLHKLVNGIVRPSWLTKIKSSATSPPKKLLPLFKANTHVSSISTSSSKRNNTEKLRPLVAYDNTDDHRAEDEEPCSKACAESSIILVAKQGKAARMKQNAQKNDEKPHHRHHHHQDHNDPHHPLHVDVKTYINKGMHEHHHHHHHQDLPHHEKPHHRHHHYQDHDDPRHPHRVDLKTYINLGIHEHGTNSCTPPGTPSSRKQGTPSIHKDKHDHPPQQQHGNRNNALGLQKRNQCMPEVDNHHHQEARSGRLHNADNAEFCNRDFLELDEEVNEDNHHNYHEKEQSHELEIGYEHYKNGYHDLLGIKRKSQYLQEEEEEEGQEEEEGDGSGNTHTTRWGWKRRKGERGSCELPESICSVVGYCKAVVKHSQEPHMVLWESMVEMIVGNGIWESGNLKFLLFCYLSLNEPHLHPIIQSSFLKVLTDLEITEPQG